MILFYFSPTQSKTQAFIADSTEEGDKSGQVWSTSQNKCQTLSYVTINTWDLCKMMAHFSPRHRAHECSLCFTSICIHGLDLMAHSCSHIEHLLINVLPNGHCSSRLQQITQCAPLWVHKNVSSNWLYKWSIQKWNGGIGSGWGGTIPSSPCEALSVFWRGLYN